MFDGDGSHRQDLPKRPSFAAPDTDRSTRARRPGDDRAAHELARLQKWVRRQDEAISRLTEAVLALRRGSQALREENRELRMQLEAAQHGRHRAGLRPFAERFPTA